MEDVQFVGPDSYQNGNKEGLSFREIVLKQVSRVARVQSQEFTGGYWNEKDVMTKYGGGTIARWYVPDSREEFVNSVVALHDLLYAHFDKEMMRRSKEFFRQHEEYRKKCWNKYVKDQMTEKEKRIGYTHKAYKNDKARNYRHLLLPLIELLKRLRYLEGTTFEEDVA